MACKLADMVPVIDFVKCDRCGEAAVRNRTLRGDEAAICYNCGFTRSRVIEAGKYRLKNTQNEGVVVIATNDNVVTKHILPIVNEHVLRTFDGKFNLPELDKEKTYFALWNGSKIIILHGRLPYPKEEYL